MNAKLTMRMALGCSVLMAVCQSTTLAGGFGGHMGGGSFSAPSFHSMPSAPVKSFQPNFNASNFKVQTQTIKPVQTPLNQNALRVTQSNLSSKLSNITGTQIGNSHSGLTLQNKLNAPLKIYQPLPSSPTGYGANQGSGLNQKLKTPVVGGVLGNVGANGNGGATGGSGTGTGTGGSGTGSGGSTPTGGSGSGSTPPSGGNMPPSGPTCPTGGYCNGGYCGNNWWGYGPAFYGNWGYGCGTGGYGASSASPVVYNAVPASGPALVDTAAAAPLATAANSADKLTLKLGQSYTIVNDHFGDQAGDLSVAISGVTLPIRVDKWDAEQITFTLPTVGLDKATDGLFNVAGPDHKLTKAVPVVLVAAQ